MATGIEWSDETWNPVVGCSHVSTGCDGCYAAREAFGRLKGSPIYAGLAEKRTPDELPRFTGEVRLLPDRLDQPLRWRRPRRIFANSMSDLFHPDVPVGFICDVFVRMGLANRHQFQVLTKRPSRMASILNDPAFRDEWFYARERRAIEPDVQRLFDSGAVSSAAAWPLPNVWLGTSVEDQRYANIRIPDLLATPAAVRFLSVEPLLGPVSLTRWLHGGFGRAGDHDEIGWVIVGGESGPRSRPMYPGWATDLRDECVAAGVPFLFKQWGEWAPYAQAQADLGNDEPVFARAQAEVARGALDVVTTHDPADPACMIRVGKKAAGRTLDGRTWDEYPA